MTKKLRVLIVEDVPSDAELAVRELNNVIPNFTVHVVDTKKDYVQALKTFKPDLIISDYSMPSFDGLTALKIRQEKYPTTPFIILTGSINENTAVECMQAGADDYVIKEFIKRLGQSALNAIEKKKIEVQYKQAEEDLKISSIATETSLSAIFASNINGAITYANKSAAKMWGYKCAEEMIGTDAIGYWTQSSQGKAMEMIEILLKDGSVVTSGDLIGKRLDGTEFIVESNSILVKDENGKPTGLIGSFSDITERKKAEEDLNKLTTLNKMILDTAGEGIYGLDLNGNTTFINPAAAKMIGWEMEEILGKSQHDLLHHTKTDGTVYDRNECPIYAAYKDGKVHYVVDEVFWHKDGSSFPVEYISTPILDEQGKPKGAVVTFKDITEQKRAENIQKVLYNISNAVITTDNLKELIGLIQKELGTIIDTTNFYVALYDAKTDMFSLPLFADDFEEVSSFPAKKTFSNYIIKTQKSLLANKDKVKKMVKSGDVEIVGPASETWLGVPLKIEGKITGVLAVQSYTDKNAYTTSDMEVLEFVSDQISISIERKKAEEDLIIALKKATESDRLKSAFLAAMSHELRTPLNAIIGFSDIITKDLPVDEIVGFAKIINSSGEHLLTIIEDLFDITLIESGTSTINNSEVSLHPILDEILEIVKIEQYKTNKSNLVLKHTIPFGARDLIINTDSSKLKQILINLLKNALKFTNEGQIRYGYSIDTDQDKPMLKFFVEDTGIGIQKDKQEFIFDIFRQVEDSHTREFGGTGIGLSISKKLTKLLGGSIWLESEEGKGSTFYFTIPFDGFEVVDKKNEIETVIKTEAKTSLKNKTILIVEDDEVSYEYLKLELEKYESNIIWAENGKESIIHCKENNQIDLVLMDINMLVMNGYEATMKIKKFRPDLPIIAQTAYALAGDREKSIDAGCDDYITKPINKEELFKKIESCLRLTK